MHAQGQKTTNELAYDLNTTLLLLGAYGVFMMQGGKVPLVPQGAGHGRQFCSSAGTSWRLKCVARSGASRACATCQCMVAHLCMQPVQSHCANDSFRALRDVLTVVLAPASRWLQPVLPCLWLASSGALHGHGSWASAVQTSWPVARGSACHARKFSCQQCSNCRCASLCVACIASTSTGNQLIMRSPQALLMIDRAPARPPTPAPPPLPLLPHVQGQEHVQHSAQVRHRHLHLLPQLLPAGLGLPGPARVRSLTQWWGLQEGKAQGLRMISKKH